MTVAEPAFHPLSGRRSYGRSRPLRASGRAAIGERMPERSIELPDGGAEIDPRSLFADGIEDVWLEVGFGAGEHLLGRMRANPSVAFIGCEPYLAGMAAMLARAESGDLGRLRVFPEDARLLLPRLAPESLGRVFVLFPDPWPKRRHHRRRLVQADTLGELARILRPGGELLFASDHAPYVRETLALACDRGDFDWLAERARDWRSPPAGWIETRFQKRAEAEGRPSYYLRFRRI